MGHQQNDTLKQNWNKTEKNTEANTEMGHQQNDTLKPKEN